MEYNPDVQDDLGTGGRVKNWMQDNIRIILSVLIVLAIAGGIYSYSKRSEPSLNEDLAMTEESQPSDQEEKDNDAVSIIGEEKTQENKEEKQNEEEKVAQTPDNQTGENKDVKTEPQKPQTTPEPKKEDVKVIGENQNQGNQTASSEETDDAFVEAAASGDSVTTLGRKALSDYLEKNNDSSLGAEHKIYIEDYLRKHTQHRGNVLLGEKISFSKVLIKDAIEKAKTLNENQLNNLKQYSARVQNI